DRHPPQHRRRRTELARLETRYSWGRTRFGSDPGFGEPARFLALRPSSSLTPLSRPASVDPQLRIPDDFPQVRVGIRKVTGVTAPERLRGSLDDRRAGTLRLCHDLVDFLLRA